MKIQFQKHTIIGRNPWLDVAYESHFKQILLPSTMVVFGSLPIETYDGTLPADYVKFGQLETFFSWYFADQAVEAERNGFAAYVIGTSQDPGLEMARSLVSIPVVGYGETAFSLLHTQGIPFGVVGFIPELEEILRRNLDGGNWSDSCVGFGYLRAGRHLIENAVATGDVAELIPVMVEEVQRLALLGAQAIIPGEGLINEALWAAGITEIAGLPIIDADGMAVTMAEMLAKTKSQSMWGNGANGYSTRRASNEVVDRMRSLFGPAISHRNKHE